MLDARAQPEVVNAPPMPLGQIGEVPAAMPLSTIAENVCCAVQVFAWASARLATTAPVVGEIVSVPSLLETDVASGEQFAFPLAAIPVAPCPAPHCVGVDARAVAVAALPVTFEGCAQIAFPDASTPRAKLTVLQSVPAVASAAAVVAAIVPLPEKLSDAPVPTTIAALVFVPLVIEEKGPLPPPPPVPFVSFGASAESAAERSVLPLIDAV